MPLYRKMYVDRDELRLTESGYIAETYPRGASTGTFLGGVSGFVLGGLVGLKAGEIITNIHCVVGTAGTTVSLAKLGIYSTAGARLAVTGNDNTNFDDNAGLFTVALAAPYTVLADDGYYLVVLQTAATVATVLRPSAYAGTGDGVGSAPDLFVAEAGQTDLDATCTFATTANGLWLACS